MLYTAPRTYCSIQPPGPRILCVISLALIRYFSGTYALFLWHLHFVSFSGRRPATRLPTARRLVRTDPARLDRTVARQRTRNVARNKIYFF